MPNNAANSEMLSCGPDTTLPPDGVPAVVMWDINGTDAARTRDFYRTVFGWHMSDPGDGPVYLATVESGMGGIRGVIGQAPKDGDADLGVRHQGLTMYIKVRDVGDTLRKAEAEGGRIIWGPNEVAPGFWLAQFEDPDGVRIGLST